MGYWNNPTTEASIKDGWLTGDIGRLDEDGTFTSPTGRKTCRRRRVRYQEVEEVIRQFDGIKEAAANRGERHAQGRNDY